MKKIINSEKLNVLGPYSHVVAASGEIFYFSGQLGINPETQEMGKSIQEQTRYALKNIDLLLQQAGLVKENIVKVLVLLKDMADFSEMNQVYGEYFTQEPPARSAFQVAALPSDGLIEIEVIAVKL